MLYGVLIKQNDMYLVEQSKQRRKNSTEKLKLQTKENTYTRRRKLTKLIC